MAISQKISKPIIFGHPYCWWFRNPQRPTTWPRLHDPGCQPGYGAEDGGELPGLVHWGEGGLRWWPFLFGCLRGRWLPGEQKMCFFFFCWTNQDLGETDGFGIRGLSRLSDERTNAFIILFSVKTALDLHWFYPFFVGKNEHFRLVHHLLRFFFSFPHGSSLRRFRAKAVQESLFITRAARCLVREWRKSTMFGWFIS